MATTGEVNVCPICLNPTLEFVRELSCSIWLMEKELKEAVRSVALLTCPNCRHYMTDTRCYNEDFFDFLYPDNSTSDALRSKPDIYDEIIAFNLQYLNLHNILKIVDLGGGEGDFLKRLASERNIQGSIREMTIYERKAKHSIRSGIDFIQLDFNQIGNFIRKGGLRFNYAFCIHVLEHLLEPRAFLQTIYNSCDRYYLYVEVPSLKLLDIHSSVAIVHPSHIHYFTLENLVYLMTDIGFEVMRAEVKKTDGIPRLQLIARKISLKLDPISELIHQEVERLKFIYRLITENTLCHDDKVGLWGIGEEFRILFARFPALKTLLDSGQLVLIDSMLKGTSFRGSVISAPDATKSTEGLRAVIIMPKAEITRKSIHGDAMKMGFPTDILKDPYEPLKS